MRRYLEGDERLYLYTRYENPTLRELEESLAALEGAEAGLVFASGMAAMTTALFSLVQAGDEVLASASLYGGRRGPLLRLPRPPWAAGGAGRPRALLPQGARGLHGPPPGLPGPAWAEDPPPAGGPPVRERARPGPSPSGPPQGAPGRLSRLAHASRPRGGAPADERFRGTGDDRARGRSPRGRGGLRSASAGRPRRQPGGGGVAGQPARPDLAPRLPRPAAPGRGPRPGDGPPLPGGRGRAGPRRRRGAGPGGGVGVPPRAWRTRPSSAFSSWDSACTSPWSSPGDC